MTVCDDLGVEGNLGSGDVGGGGQEEEEEGQASSSVRTCHFCCTIATSCQLVAKNTMSLAPRSFQVNVPRSFSLKRTLHEDKIIPPDDLYPILPRFLVLGTKESL